MTKLEVHPVADLFPMLADDELKELAEDIKARGLLQPIVLDAEGRVLDGRNRLAACELAGVEPKFEKYDGDDPDGYALAVNVARRHLRAGARLLLTEQARRLMTGDRSKFGKNQIGNDGRLSEAAVVLDFAPDHIDNVLMGAESLRTAAEVARERKRAAAEVKAKKERLVKGAPDLADQVDDGRLDLDEALGALAVREERARQDAIEAKLKAEDEQRKLAAQAALEERIAVLPPDLAERVNSGSLGIGEAESVVKQRAERLAAWAEKVTAALETLTRMAGNPVPDDLKARLDRQQIEDLDAILGALKPQEEASA